MYKQKYSDERTDSIGSNDAIIFLNPVSYTVDQNDLNYLEAHKAAFDDEDITESIVGTKYHDLEVTEVTKGITLGCKDKRQLKRAKKLEKTELPETTPRGSILTRMFTRSTTKDGDTPYKNLSSSEEEEN